MLKLAVAMTPQRVDDVCGQELRREIEGSYEVVWGGARMSGAQVARLAVGSDVLLTGWGTPHLDRSIWAGADGPRVVAHAAGTVKKLLDREVLDQGVAVFSAASRIAWSVGEYCLGAMLTLARRLPQLDAAVRAGGWTQPRLRGHELAHRRVGILGASSTARALITLLAPFQCDIAVYDPYLDEERARRLGVRTTSLEEALSCPVVSVHVPNLPATEGMVSRTLIEAMPDGAIVVNSSRGPAVDQSALIEQARAGRLLAALDVYDAEPPVLDADTLSCPNLLLTPHVAGDTVEGHLALTGYVMADVAAWWESGARGPSWVDPAAWSTAA